MQSVSACLVAALTAAAVSAAQPPADEGPTPADALNTWKERAARAQAWLKDKAAAAEQAAADALARARRELLGVDGEVHAPALALAARKAPGGPVLWEALTADAPARPGAAVVLLVHGLDEPGPIWDELAPHLLDRGASVVRFDYPNDQAIAASAAQLLDALRDLRSRGVERVQIVAHSMGGLLARDALTRDDGYAGDASMRDGLPAVTSLIMVGTPNKGSHLARFQPVAEAREHALRATRGNPTEGAGLVGSSRDGGGEAARDLAVGSEFLRALNARPLPVGLRITTISGTLSPAAACEYLRTDAQPQWARLIGEERAAALIAQSCAAVETLGDGMVPESSTRLDGVSDHVELAADHRSLLKRWTIVVRLDELRGRETPPAAAIPVILDRLGLAPLGAPDSAPVP